MTDRQKEIAERMRETGSEVFLHLTHCAYMMPGWVRLDMRSINSMINHGVLVPKATYHDGTTYRLSPDHQTGTTQ